MSTNRLPSWVLQGDSGVESLSYISNQQEEMMNCLTGMRPSGELHLGHYVGALLNRKKLQENPKIKNNFLIADYQALGDHLGQVEKIRSSVRNMVVDRLAVGLNPKTSNFIVQSYVPEFAELFNFLTMFTSYKSVISNPTLKDEIKKIENSEGSRNKGVSLGFINYPISQVADILLPGGRIVPVGEDQIPHIEIARKVIKRVNTICKTGFDLPMALISETPRLVGTDGNNKMSKSLGNIISLSASSEEIKNQVNNMYTDPHKTSIQSKGSIDDHVVFKYLDIFFEDKDTLELLKKRYIEGGDNSIGDRELKQILTEAIDNHIKPIRYNRQHIIGDEKLISNSIEEGSENTRIRGRETLNELKEAMGLLRY